MSVRPEKEIKGKRPGKGDVGRWKGRRVSSQHTNIGFTFILSLIFYIIMSINLTCNAIIYIYMVCYKSLKTHL